MTQNDLVSRDGKHYVAEDQRETVAELIERYASL